MNYRDYQESKMNERIRYDLVETHARVVSLDKVYWNSRLQAWIPVVEYAGGKSIDQWFSTFKHVKIPTALIKLRR
jgi:hypothetical protein